MQNFAQRDTPPNVVARPLMTCSKNPEATSKTQPLRKIISDPMPKVGEYVPNWSILARMLLNSPVARVLQSVEAAMYANGLGRLSDATTSSA